MLRVWSEPESNNPNTCPLFEEAQEKLRIAFPGIDQPQKSLGRLTKKKRIKHTLEFLKTSGAFSQFHAPVRNFIFQLCHLSLFRPQVPILMLTHP